jgi:hypothetical protein
MAGNRAERRTMERARARLPMAPHGRLVEVQQAAWPRDVTPPTGLTALWQSERYVVFVCAREDGIEHVMVQRRDAKSGISWDDLFRLKAELGFADREAVELFPAESDLVFAANIRHLWVLPPDQRMPFGLNSWRS